MSRRLSVVRTLVATVAGIGAAGGALAAGPALHDQSDLGSVWINLSTHTVADDFTLAGPARLTAAQVWLVDNVGGDDGDLSSFSGSLGFAVYEDDTETPGQPGDLVQAGISRNVRQVDSGLQDGGSDVLAVTFDLDPPVSLAAGTYWLALHEGSMPAPPDGSVAWWRGAAAARGARARLAEIDVVSWTATEYEVSFVLYAAPTVWDQGDFKKSSALSFLMTTWRAANDFELAAAAAFSTVEICLTEDSDSGENDGALASFTGELWWTVYDDDAGNPGLIADQGFGAVGPSYDAGYQSSGNADVVRTRLAIGRSVKLAAGSYWLGLLEKFDTLDGNQIAWYESAQNLGGIVSDDLSNGVGWDVFHPDHDVTMVLMEDLIFAAGFEAGVACAWSSTGGLCP
jgi:hypothetical protein